MTTDANTTHTKQPYGKIFLALLALTVLEVFAANLPFSKTMIALTLIAFALLKAGLVGAFYMHLRFEKVLLTVLALAPLIFSVVLVIGVGFDIR